MTSERTGAAEDAVRSAATERPHPSRRRLHELAVKLGFADAGAFLIRRYVDEKRSSYEIADEVGVSIQLVLEELRAAGGTVRRRGHRYAEERRRRRHAELDAILASPPPLRFGSWREYLLSRVDPLQRFRAQIVARETGLTVWTAQLLASHVGLTVGPYYLRRRVRERHEDQ